MKNIIDRLYREHTLSKADTVHLLENFDASLSDYLFTLARQTQRSHFGDAVYTRGLIEFTNYCANDCYYCGIRRGNRRLERYRLSKEQILACCRQGYELGFRTFVLQGGEDGAYTDAKIADIVASIKEAHPDCAVTLSIGERSYATYKMWFEAGADRYLLRHETADAAHYRLLHPPALSLANRQQCLWNLKEIGYQAGTGFMVGSPGQTAAHLAADLQFIERLQPQMVGIGPFIPHHATQFARLPSGRLDLTLFLIGLLRLLLPKALLPATTALGTIHPRGREQGILAGANVVMPNLSPLDVRGRYALYDNKICTGDEAAECRADLERHMAEIGYRLAVDRGDYR